MLRGHQTQQGRPQREALAGICGQNIPREASAKQGRPPRSTICAFTQGPVPKRVPVLCFTIHCCHLKYLNHIWTRNPLFSSWTRPSKLRSQSWAEAKVLKHYLPPIPLLYSLSTQRKVFKCRWNLELLSGNLSLASWPSGYWQQPGKWEGNGKTLF